MVSEGSEGSCTNVGLPAVTTAIYSGIRRVLVATRVESRSVDSDNKSEVPRKVG